MSAAVDHQLDELLGRSHRLGADRRITNFAGGNTSAKLTVRDPVTGEPTRVLAVKGSGGDLGTLTGDGVALLVVDRVLALEALRARGVPEDDIVPYYDACRFGDSSATCSIDHFDSIQPISRQHDPAKWNAPADRARSGAGNRHRNPIAIGRGEHFRDFLDTFRKDNALGVSITDKTRVGEKILYVARFN